MIRSLLLVAFFVPSHGSCGARHWSDTEFAEGPVWTTDDSAVVYSLEHVSYWTGPCRSCDGESPQTNLGSELWTIEEPGGTPRRLTGRYPGSGLGGIQATPDWAFFSVYHYEDSTQQIVRVSLADGSETQLAQRGQTDCTLYVPRPSPDGSVVAWYDACAEPGPQVTLIDVDTLDPIASPFTVPDGTPALFWDPEGHLYVPFSDDSDKAGKSARVHPDVLVMEEGSTPPCRAPATASSRVAADGRELCLNDSVDDPVRYCTEDEWNGVRPDHGIFGCP